MLPTTLLIRGILEVSTAVFLALAMRTLPIVIGIIRFICLKAGTVEESLICKSDDHYPTIAARALIRILFKYFQHGRLGPCHHRRRLAGLRML
jgi:hypothetical protein